MSETNRLWGWTEDPNTRYHGEHSTKEGAIEEARVECGGRVFYVAEGHCPDPSSYVPDADFLIEMMNESACGECGDAAEDWPDVSNEAEQELTELLVDWARRHCPISFYLVEGAPERIV